MKSNYQSYDWEASFERLDEILDQSDLNYEEVNELPPRERLTFTNGFYAYCSALFVDIRGSSELPNKYKRPRLAKIYRAYVSEAVAIMNGDPDCVEVNIVGDAVWSIINTPKKTDIDYVFMSAYTIASMVDALNCKMQKRGFGPITVGIGMSYGRALMIKAGFKGSGINEVVYMGDVVNEAAKLASWGNSSWGDKEIMVSPVFQQNLNDDNRALLEWNAKHSCYHGNVVRTVMNDWLIENCS